METLEIVFGNSCYYSIRNSELKNNDILMINTLFNLGDLSNIEKYTINIPDELCLDEKNDNIEEETKIIINNINKKNKIRIWTSHNDIYSYLIMLYVSSIVKTYNYELYVLYSDEYNKEYPSPAVMKEEELVKLTQLEHKLSDEEITVNSNIWKKLIRENSDLRIIEDGKVKSVSLGYYDKFILDTLKKMKKVKMSQLVGKLISDVYLQDILYVYLIKKLIEKNKIKITIGSNTRYFESLVEIIE